MFHISPTRNRDSIRRHGLHLSTIDRTHLWLFADEQAARRFLPESFDCSRGHNDLWHVDVTGLDVHPDPHPGWDDVDSLVVTVPVDPSRIHLADTHIPQETITR